MNFNQEIIKLSNTVEKQLHITNNEESTKNSLILPFINILEYDHLNTREVVPEFNVDIFKGRRCDYAIINNGKPIIILECKSADFNIKKKNEIQLFDYLHTSQIPIGILTNGVTYQFYFQIETKFRREPFFVFNILEDSHNEDKIEMLSNFNKNNIDTFISGSLEYLIQLSVEYFIFNLQDPKSHSANNVLARFILTQMGLSDRMIHKEKDLIHNINHYIETLVQVVPTEQLPNIWKNENFISDTLTQHKENKDLEQRWSEAFDKIASQVGVKKGEKETLSFLVKDVIQICSYLDTKDGNQIGDNILHKDMDIEDGSNTARSTKLGILFRKNSGSSFGNWKIIDAGQYKRKRRFKLVWVRQSEIPGHFYKS